MLAQESLTGLQLGVKSNSAYKDWASETKPTPP